MSRLQSHEGERTFYCPEAAEGTEAALDPVEAGHAVRVLRLGVGDAVTLFDGQGRFYEATITETGKRSATVRVGAARESAAEPRARVVLLVGCLKGVKADFLVQKCVELGVAELVFFGAERSVARPRADGGADRYQGTVVSACKQCGRAGLMPVVECESLEAALARVPSDGLERVVYWEEAVPAAEAGTVPLLSDVGGLPAEAGTTNEGLPEGRDASRGAGAYAIVGPEGGLTAREVAAARAAGFAVRSLGRRILRAETAALTAAVLLLHGAGELG